MVLRWLIGADQFSSSCCGVFPFGTAEATGLGEESGGIIGAHQRKETPSKLGVSGINAAFSAAVESGETGIRTLGTREGTPVFKTGAIGRSAISPGRMVRRGAGVVNAFPPAECESPAIGINKACGKPAQSAAATTSLAPHA